MEHIMGFFSFMSEVAEEGRIAEELAKIYRNLSDEELAKIQRSGNSREQFAAKKVIKERQL